MRSHQAYAATQRETAVSSARPIDLVVMVYERLLDHLRSAQLQMGEGTDPTDSLTKAIDLITTGLEACLDKAQGGEIAENLAVIYGWANREIMRARLRRDPALLADDLLVAANQTMSMSGTEARSVRAAMAA